MIEGYGANDINSYNSSTKKQTSRQATHNSVPIYRNNKKVAHKEIQKLHDTGLLKITVTSTQNSTPAIQAEDKEVLFEQLDSSSFATIQQIQTLPDFHPTTSIDAILLSTTKISSGQRITLPQYASTQHKLDAQAVTMARMSSDLFYDFIVFPEADVDRWLIERGWSHLVRRAQTPVVEYNEEDRKLFGACDAFVKGLDEMRSEEQDDPFLAGYDLVCLKCEKEVLDGCPGH